MKNNLIIGFFLGLLLSCNAPKNNPEGIQFDFTIKSFALEDNQMEVNYKLTNGTNLRLKGGQWALHWNQIIGTPVPESLPEGVSFEWVNGQLYLILSFGENWTLNPGESLSFGGLQKGIINREVMGPLGAFIVYDNGQVIDLDTKLHWKEAQGLDQLGIPSAEDRYEALGPLSLLPKKELQWVVPKPKQVVSQSGNKQADAAWQLYIAPKFQAQNERLVQQLQTQFDLPIALVDKPEAANFSLLYQENLHPEGYGLALTKENIKLSSSTEKGIFYALQSLDQIIYTATLEGTDWPLLEIEDAPRFAYRGFMLDIARNYYGLEKIKKVIDAMAYYKLNHLDLRLSDDEGWRLEIEGLPELTAIGGQRGYSQDQSEQLIPFYGSGAKGGDRGNGFLTTADFVALLKYANEKHITVMPQISFPSHARAAIKAMETRLDETYRLVDPEDQSQYRSAQLFDDNVICICQDSAFDFYEKVIVEIKKMYEAAGLPLTQFSIGADELPYGVWTASPLCEAYMKKNQLNNTIELYDHALRKVKEIFDRHQITMAGWEDFLLAHSEKSQEETQIKKEEFNREVIPYVWNNIWGAGREDMIYKFANRGFKTVMSNSAAFYFDMTDDRDFENYGLNWSGYVNYKDSWATDPEDVFNNAYLNQKNNITPDYIEQKTKLDPKKSENLLGIQSQLWTETVSTESIFDALFLPNLIVFAERAWAPRPHWTSLKGAEQIAAMNQAWNQFSNSLGQRQLPLVDLRLAPWAYDLPKAGGLFIDQKLHLKQDFPGMNIHYTLDNSEPSPQTPLYEAPIAVDPKSKVKIRVFNAQGRGGKTIEIN